MKLRNHIISILRITCLTAGLFGGMANAQLTEQTLSDKFNRYGEKVLQEKLYLHIDRNFYLAGDIIWGRLSVVDASLHQPIDISKVAYIEVLDENNTPVLQTKVSIEKGRGNASINIPVSIRSGNYKVRAYTSWMKNNGPDYFFEKVITIVNAQKSRENISGKTNSAAQPEIRFFPEGGNLVTGISSTVACKVTGADGKGIAFIGQIVDETNTPAASFRSLQFGMGSFAFTPLAGHTYKAVVETGQGKFTVAIPDIYPAGYVMQLHKEKEQLSISIQTNLKDTGTLFLLAHTRMSLKTVLQGRLEKGKIIFRIDASKLGEGISQLTVFNSAGKPLCERLYFTYPSRELSLHMKGNEMIYPVRSKVDVIVEPDVQNKKPSETDMSVAVFRLDDLQTLDESDIRSYLWLSSDLKGYIESPAYYFQNRSEETMAVMDNLMLTQGWRRFSWDKLLTETKPAVLFPPELSGHIITGKVISTVTGKPAENIETFISVPGLNANFRTYISDSSGKVKFDFQNMKGSSEIIIQTNPTADTLTRVELNNPFLEQYTPSHLPDFRLSVTKEKTLLDQSINVQVQNIYAGPMLKRFLQSPDSVTTFEKPDAVYMMDDYTRFTTIEEVLREYVTLMDVQKIRGKFSLQLLDNFPIPKSDMGNKQFFQTDPLILVDGVPVFNVDRLMSYDPLKMRKLEVYNRRYFLDNSFFSGILNWASYKGDLANFELDPRALVIDYEGLQLQREFYSPAYQAGTSQTNTPDFRTLLYWSPLIKADKNGEYHLQYFTSDKKGKYITVIQGLTNKGECGTLALPFEVR